MVEERLSANIGKYQKEINRRQMGENDKVLLYNSSGGSIGRRVGGKLKERLPMEELVVQERNTAYIGNKRGTSAERNDESMEITAGHTRTASWKQLYW